MNPDGYLSSDLLRGSEIPAAIFRDLPKCELHVHLDGSLRLATLLELYRSRGLELPGGGEEAFTRILTAGPSRLDHYIELFGLVHPALQDAESLERVAFEIAEDCAAENVVHLEMRFSPVLHTQGGLSPEAAVDAVLAGLARAQRASGISAGLLLTALRHHPPDESRRMAELAVAYKGRGVTGFDLAGVESGNPAKQHREAFYVILNENINCTVHAGEDFGPASIHQALHYLGAHRIGHGTRLLEDPGLLAYVADHRIPLEVGLSSNVRTGAVPTVEAHPLRRFLRAGLRVTLGTHNRLFLGNDLSGELRLAATTFDLTLLEVENLLIAGFKSAFLPQNRRIELMRRAIAEFSEVRRRHGLEAVE
jgi:adenosine deaminase